MSALDHTKIEGANDPQMVAAEAEAAQVARRAAEALRRSRQACQVCPFWSHTWAALELLLAGNISFVFRQHLQVMLPPLLIN